MTEIDKYRHWVVPIIRQSGNEQSFAGTAFVVNNYLVTAGHVITENRSYYAKVEDNYLELKPGKWIPPLIRSDDKLGWDVALLPVNAPTSPLSFADTEAKKHDELDLLCWQIVDGRLEQVHTPCVVIGDDNNTAGYIMIATARPITHGASGSPVFRDGKVYGLLAMGRDEYKLPETAFNLTPRERALMKRFGKNTCWVFKTSHIKRFV